MKELDIYLNYADYSEARPDSTIKEDDYKPIAVHVSRLFDAYTLGGSAYCIKAEGSILVEQIGLAMLYQIDLIERVGYAAWAEGSNLQTISSESESIGNYSKSVSYKSSVRKTTFGAVEISPLAKNLLAPVLAIGRRLK